MKRLVALSLLLVPAIAFALEFTDLTDRYTDAPFSTAEMAGISVLTEIEAVSGNPDGTFAAERTLNRAEFVKIAARATPNLFGPWIEEVDKNCFPDVQSSHWFSRDICGLKEMDAIEGYPDGLFHPEREVNYAEAVKILVELFGYVLPEPAPNERWAWYTGYIKAAESHGVALPGSVEPGDLLTRGQMARLAAAFVADAQHQLDEYRSFEKAQSSSSVPSESSASSFSSLHSPFSSSSSSISSSAQSVYPAVSHIVVAGETTPVLFDGLFTSHDEDAEIQYIVLQLRTAVESIDFFELVDEYGNDILDIPLQTYSNTSELLWRADVTQGQGYILQKEMGKRLGIRARLKTSGAGAVSSEVIELKTLTFYISGKTTGSSVQVIPSDTHYPWHQTAFGHITSVRNAAGSVLATPQGTSKLLGTFIVEGEEADGVAMTVKSLSFVLQTTDVSVSNLEIGGSSEVTRSDCAVGIENNTTVATCILPESLQGLASGSLTVSVYGTVAVGASKQNGTVRLMAVGPGSINAIGGVSWNDGANTFNWVDADTLLEDGPSVTVTK